MHCIKNLLRELWGILQGPGPSETSCLLEDFKIEGRGDESKALCLGHGKQSHHEFFYSIFQATNCIRHFIDVISFSSPHSPVPLDIRPCSFF